MTHTRRVSVAGITCHPTKEWMTQMARNAVDEGWGYLRRHRYVLHDRDTKFCADFRKTLATGGVKCLRLRRIWKQQLVRFTLVIPLAVIMPHQSVLR